MTLNVSQPAIAQLQPALSAIAQPPSSHSKGTILLVEDDDALRGLLRYFLRKQGYTVLDAPFNSTALLMGGRYTGRIHLLVADMMMPGTTGHELAQRLRKRRPDMNVLYISGQSREFIDRKKLLEPGAAFLQKPFEPPALLEKVDELVGAQQRPVSRSRALPQEETSSAAVTLEGPFASIKRLFQFLMKLS